MSPEDERKIASLRRDRIVAAKLLKAEYMVGELPLVADHKKGSYVASSMLL